MLHKSVNSLLILVLAFCHPALGGNSGDEPRSESKPAAAPMGAIESVGAIRIDGRIAHSGAVLWGNEFLEAPAIESAQIMLNDTGLITLSGGASLKLMSAIKEDGGASELIAYLMAGSMTIKLNDKARARICAIDSIFSVSPGSSARLLVSEGHGRLLSSKGEVKEDSDWRLFQAVSVATQSGAQMTPGEYTIKPYNFAFSLGGYADIEARSVRYLQFRVTDKDDRPAPDLLLLFLLKNGGDSSSGLNSGAGSINYGAVMMRATTDHNGVATARFDAGVTVGATASIEATIMKTNQVFKTNIRIIKPKGFWTLKNALPMMTATAAAAAVSVVAARSGDSRLSIISPPPPMEEGEEIPCSCSPPMGTASFGQFGGARRSPLFPPTPTRMLPRNLGVTFSVKP